MKTFHVKESGFSAVELLITLFIAAAFLATAYQLYAIIIQDGGDARAQAKASNIAYDYLRQYSPKATNPCSNVTLSPTPTLPAGNGLPSPTTLSVTVQCATNSGSSTVSRVQVNIKYGPTPQKEVTHAVFVSK